MYLCVAANKLQTGKHIEFTQARSRADSRVCVCQRTAGRRMDGDYPQKESENEFNTTDGRD